MASGSQNMVSDKARQAFYLQAPNEAGGHTDQYGNLLHNRGTNAASDSWNIKKFDGTSVVRVYWETGEIDGIGAHSITLPNGSQGEFYAGRGNVGIWMGIGSGNTNHGLYSEVKGDWMIYANSSGSVQVNGNAATATKLAAPRDLTIGATAKPFDGSKDVSWSMDEIMGSSDSSKFYRGDKTWSNTIVGAFTASSSGSNRANINMITVADQPNDFYLGNNNASKWSITSRASNESYNLYVYSTGSGVSYATGWEYSTGKFMMLHGASLTGGSLVIDQPATARRNGIIGTYDYTKAAAIWAMGSSYQIAADGSGLGSLYGAAYVYQGQGGTGGKTLAGGHQFVWAENGGIDVALGGNGVWIKKNGGIYWDPYVESASDASDVTSIYQIASGVAGGTELRINQQNDAADCINLCTNSYIYLNSKRVFTINDSWLRINEDKGFSSGIYTGSSLIRTDNQLQVGSSGGNFYANSSGNGYFSNTLGIAGTNTGYNLYVNGTAKHTGRLYQTNWIEFTDSSGLYLPSSGSGTHFYPANDVSYGSFQMIGAKGGYRGITMGTSNNDLTIMSDGTNEGLYNANKGRWIIYYHRTNDQIGIFGSSVASGYNVRVNGSLYVNSTLYVPGDHIYTDKNVYCHCLWANRSDGERQVGVDYGTSGTLYLWSNGTNKGLYSSTGYSTGSVITIDSGGRKIYGHDTWGNKVRMVDNWLGFYGSTHGGTRYGYIQADANRMYYRKENGVSTYHHDFNGHVYASSNLYAGSSVLANNGYLYSTANSVTVQIGGQNSSWCHFTGAPQYYFDKSIHANGALYVYNTTHHLDSTAIWASRWRTPNLEFAELDSSSIGLCNHGQGTAKRLNVGALLVSSAWADAGNVPTNGIYCKGVIYCSNEFISSAANGLRIKNMILRNDGSDVWFLIGTSNTPGDNWNSLRPLRFNIGTGIVYMGHGLTTNNIINLSTSTYGDARCQIKISSNRTFGLHLGAGGVNRGIYDWSIDHWLVWYDDWNASLQARGGWRVCIQNDGNLVVYKGTTAYWSSKAGRLRSDYT